MFLKKASKIIAAVTAAAVLVFSTMLVPGMAAEYTYRDYIKQTYSQGDTTICVLEYSSAYTQWTISGMNVNHVEIGPSVSYTYEDGGPDPNNFIIEPRPNSNETLSLSGIPQGSLLNVEFTYRGYIQTFTGDWTFVVEYFDENEQVYYAEYSVVSSVTSNDQDATQDVTKLSATVTMEWSGSPTRFKAYFYNPYGTNEVDFATMTITQLSCDVRLTVPTSSYNSGIMEDIANGTPGQNQQSEELKDKAEQGVNDMQDAISGMEQLNKPNVNVNMNANAIVSQTYINMLVTFLTPLTQSEIITSMLTAVLTVVLGAYILFGKR